MHYLVFIPELNAGPDQLTAVGLADHVAGYTQLNTATGPDGGRGSIIGWTRKNPAQSLAYRPESQRWFQSLNKKFWIGVENDHPLGPSDLEREESFDGYWCQLGDGNKWVMPSASRLPHDFRMSGDGKVELVIQDRFRDFWRQSREWYDRFSKNPEDQSVSIPGDWWSYITFALSLNYRILPEVISELRLLTTRNVVKCAMATVDYLAITEAEEQKKSTE